MACERCGSISLPEGARVCEPCAEQLAEQHTVHLPFDGLEQLVRSSLGRDHDVDKQLGRGGMSVVYLARELALGRMVALKVLPLHLAFDEEAVDRFEREARISASLDHPHIVPVYRIGRTSTFLWYSMKYVKGRSLASVLDAAGELDLELAMDLTGQVASALHYAHQRGIIHRDVKPENVMIDDHGWAWVCDFGIAKAFGALPLTQTGSTVGTPGYMSPEQCYGQALDGRADQYALAIMIWQMLAGHRPFEADSLGEMIRMQCLEPPPRLSEARPGTPAHVVEALYRAMSKKPTDRFPHVVDFVEALGGTVAVHQARAALQQLVHALPEPAPRRASGARRSIPKAASDAPTIPSVRAPVAKPQPARRPARWRVAAGLAVLLAGGAGTTAVLKTTDAGAAAQPLPVAQALEVDTPVTATPPARSPFSPSSPSSAEEGEKGEEMGPISAAARPVTPAVLRIPPTNPWGMVYVNDSLVGETPITRLPLPPGTYRIRVEQDCYEPFTARVTLAAGENRLLAVTLTPRADCGTGGP